MVSIISMCYLKQRSPAERSPGLTFLCGEETSLQGETGSFSGGSAEEEALHYFLLPFNKPLQR